MIVPDLPKTRSGKIMRRLLRSIARGEEISQDISTLENPAIVAQLRGEEPPRVPVAAKKRAAVKRAAVKRAAVKRAAVSRSTVAKKAVTRTRPKSKSAAKKPSPKRSASSPRRARRPRRAARRARR